MSRARIPIAKPVINHADLNEITTCILSGNLAQGKLVQSFETAFASYTGTRHAIATSSGTTALHLALLAHGVGWGDEVITTPFSFIASANAILYCEAKPVFCDVSPHSFNLNPACLEELITPHTRAVMGVHLYGQVFDVGAVSEICARHNLALIEDACQAHGAELDGKKAGSFGTGCFSFYPTKNMTTGEGGIITTDDEEVAEKCRMLRNHGQAERYCHTMLGYNYRMTELAAAIGLSQIKHLDVFNDRRISNARILTDGIKLVPGLTAPVVMPGNKHVFHQYTIRVTPDYPLTRDELKDHLLSKGIGCAVHYPVPIHQQPYYRELGYSCNLPVSEQASCEVVSLPVHPSVTRGELDYILEVLRHAGHS